MESYCKVSPRYLYNVLYQCTMMLMYTLCVWCILHHKLHHSPLQHYQLQSKLMTVTNVRPFFVVWIWWAIQFKQLLEQNEKPFRVYMPPCFNVAFEAWMKGNNSWVSIIYTSVSHNSISIDSQERIHPSHPHPGLGSEKKSYKIYRSAHRRSYTLRLTRTRTLFFTSGYQPGWLQIFTGHQRKETVNQYAWGRGRQRDGGSRKTGKQKDMLSLFPQMNDHSSLPLNSVITPWPFIWQSDRTRVSWEAGAGADAGDQFAILLGISWRTPNSQP